MITNGDDLIRTLTEIGFRPNQLVWRLLRTDQANTEFLSTGVTIAAILTNQIVGEALSHGHNTIITSSRSLAFETNPKLTELAEILYQQSIYVLEWNFSWLWKTKEGLHLLSKVLHADSRFHFRQCMPNMVLSFQQKVPLTSILDRFSSRHLLSARKMKPSSMKVKKLLLILNWENIDHTLQNYQSEDIKIILTPQLPSRPLIWMSMNYHVVWINEIELLNEISRELYYVLKRGESLDMTYQLNRIPTISSF